jgi:hypothetical protein
MSLIYNTSPSGTPSVHDNLWHIVSSDHSGTTDFKYVFDIWINGVQKVRVKQVPEPNNGKAYFDAGPIVRNEMTYDWFEPINSSAYVSQPDMSGDIGIRYQLRIGEDYSGTVTTNMVSGETNCYNWTPNLFKRTIDNLQLRLNKWLTNRPLTAQTKIGENLFIGFYTDTTLTLHCQTFDYSNNSITTADGTPVTVTDGFVQMNIGTAALNATLGITINEGVKYYDVWFNSFDKIRVHTTCNPKYEPITIHFLNRWGLYDTHRFDLVSKLNMAVQRKEFEQRDYRFNGNSVDYKSSSNRYYEGKMNYFNAATWQYKLTSNALSDSEYTWLSDLIVSPQILMEVDGYFYPVTVKSDNYEYKKNVVDKLSAFEVVFEMNQTRYSQLR